MGRTLPICIVAGNKCDLQSNRQVGARDGLEWARSRGYGFMETSAREMVNIEETFALLVRRVVDSRRQHQQGLTPNLPSSTARTQPLEPLGFGSEKNATQPGEAAEGEKLPLVKRLLAKLKSLKCW